MSNVKSNKTRNTIAMEIAHELLNEGVLDENNFSYNTDVLLQSVSQIILEHLKNYVLVSGTLI